MGNHCLCGSVGSLACRLVGFEDFQKYDRAFSTHIWVQDLESKINYDLDYYHVGQDDIHFPKTK